MIEARTVFQNREDAAAYVRASEVGYNDTIRRIADRILSEGKYRFVTLAGPSCSGKTTTAKRLSEYFAAAGKDLHIISIDDFYYSREEIHRRAAEKGQAPDYDSVASIDLDLFSKAVSDVRAGGYVHMPTYDFTIGKQGGLKSLRADFDDIFLFEGIQAVYPEVSAILGHSDCYSLFIEPSESVKVSEYVFEPYQIRFLRRLVRDSKYRSADAVTTFRMWDGVRQNELRSIYPYIGDVDERINSTMAYGIGMLVSELLPLLRRAFDDKEFGERARRLEAALRDIPSIDKDLLPENSVYHEFVG